MSRRTENHIESLKIKPAISHVMKQFAQDIINAIENLENTVKEEDVESIEPDPALLKSLKKFASDIMKAAEEYDNALEEGKNAK